jgi:uncharacterized OB-fold protein
MSKFFKSFIRFYVDKCWSCGRMTDYHDGRCEHCNVKL